ncbi:MAG: hypothetical protein HW416_3002 [Chloroflexi bacterium]|nr:hypothetical protein [Chloroflexota bacterium]
MAIVVTGDLPGGSAEQDTQMQRNLNLAGNPPAGALARIAGPIESGWRVVSVWESQDAWDAFHMQRLAPALEKAGIQAPEFQIWRAESVFIPRPA